MASVGGTNEMILAQIHDSSPQEPFHESHSKLLKMVQAGPEPIRFPQLVVRFGSFSEFCEEWTKTSSMSTTQQTYYRRNLTRYFKPILLTDTDLDPCLFRFCAYSLYDF